MAIKKDVTINVYGQEVSFPEAYHFISAINWNKETDTADFTVKCCQDDTGENVLYQKGYTFKPETNSDSENFIVQAYKYLESHEDFQ